MTCYAVIIPDGWMPDGAYSVAAHCGHAHRSLRAAEHCQARLLRLYCGPGERNAKWANSVIALVDRHGRPFRPAWERGHEGE